MFVARNVNPNYYTGAISNGIGALMGGPKALRQNCVYCSKAVDQNLEALASGTPAKFWVATDTSAANLPHENNDPKAVKAQVSIEEMIKAEIEPGRRGIISVPQRKAKDNHAMNVVRADSGAIHVIDGQNGRLYDLSNQLDQQDFNTTFGHNGGPCMARFFDTGEAPKAPTQQSLTEDWVRV